MRERRRPPARVLANSKSAGQYGAAPQPPEKKRHATSRRPLLASTRWARPKPTTGLQNQLLGDFSCTRLVFVLKPEPTLLLCGHAPLRANLVGRAEEWRWGSLGRRGQSAPAGSRVGHCRFRATGSNW